MCQLTKEKISRFFEIYALIVKPESRAVYTRKVTVQFCLRAPTFNDNIMFTVFNIEKDNTNLMYFNTWFKSMKAFFSSVTPVSKQLIAQTKKLLKLKRLTNKKKKLKKTLNKAVYKKLVTPTRYLKSIVGQWKYNSRWRKRKYLSSLTMTEFLTLPKSVVKRWFFLKRRRLSGKMWKKRRWQPFVFQQWSWAEKKRHRKRKYNRLNYKLNLSKKRRRYFSTTQALLNLSVKQQRLLTRNVYHYAKIGLWPHTVKLAIKRSIKKAFKINSRKSSSRFVSLFQLKPLTTQTSKGLRTSNFIDIGYVPQHGTEYTYNAIFTTASTMTEDLPIFALDLYNLYLHNLTAQGPVKLQQWVTRASRNKTTKGYKKLLVEYTGLLKNFYEAVTIARLKKKTPAHNAMLLINQFSRVAGSRTTNYLNKRWRFLSVKTVRFHLRHKNFQKFWRTKKSLFKMKVVMARMLQWLYTSSNSKYLLGVKLREAFFQNYETDKRFIYKKKLKLHFKFLKNTTSKISI